MDIPKLDGVAERIREARTIARLSGRELSALCGFSHSYVSHVESSRRKGMHVSTVHRLCEVLGISQDWLFNGRGKLNNEAVLRAVHRAMRAAGQPNNGPAGPFKHGKCAD